MRSEIVRKISGPPGTGKSTALLDIVHHLLEEKVKPDNIIFTTFTRAGAYEARDRACARFKLPAQSFPYFRTLHSLCYQFLPTCNIMQASDWCAIGRELGLHFTVKFNHQEDGIPKGHTKGDYLLSLWSLGRVNRVSPQEMFDQRSGYSTNLPELTYQEFAHFIASVENYKRTSAKIDFTDMLERYLNEGAQVMVDHVIVDEAQDLSKLQWAVVEKLCKHAKHIYIAGDDDQCIHEWNGANPGCFIQLAAGDQSVLPQSYRIPAAVHQLADKIIRQVGTRIPKDYLPRKELGEVRGVADLEQVCLGQGTWLLLARNQIFLREYAELCRRRGLLFTGAGFQTFDAKSLRAIESWEALSKNQSITVPAAREMYELMSQRDRVRRGFKKVLDEFPDNLSVDFPTLVRQFGLVAPAELKWHQALDMMPAPEMLYLRAVEQNGQLGKAPRIEISTIHGAKGREADHVILRPDMTARTWEGFLASPDQEHRVWYVGVTRARNTLTIVTPSTDQAYPL